MPGVRCAVDLTEVGRAAARASVRTAGGGMSVFQPMPELSAEQHDALKADIVLRGIVVPIVVDQHGRILDGHNRVRISEDLGIECPREIHHVADDDEAADLAVTLNCARRHLSREQTRQVIAGEIARRPDDSDRAIARRVGCDHKTVGSVRGEVPQSTVSKLDTDAADDARELLDQIDVHLRDMFGCIVDEIYRARSNKISAAEIAGALTIAMHQTEADQPEYMASFVRGCIYKPLINYVLTTVSDDPYRHHWDHDTFLPLTDADRQWQLECVTYAVTMRTGADVAA
jgi:hypothetical protein